jgi:hypothetical protein
MAYWGTVQAAVAQRATTAELWSAIRDAQANEPGGFGPVTVQGINEVRSAAAQLRNSGEAFGAAREDSTASGLDRSISSDMMATAPWSSEQMALTTLADYQVRFQALFTTPLGEASSVMLTAKYPNGQLPATVGELIDSLGAFAPASGSLPVGEFTGIGDVSIVAV